ncbi:MAG: type VI secretion system baseplate subunit TssK [Pirellulaceae bacterium]
MFANAPVHWHEGMFLRPQHFQVSERNIESQIRDNIQWNRHFSWGLRRFRLDTTALANNRIVINDLALRMRDGTLIAYPESGNLPELDLRQAIAGKPTVTLFAAIPKAEAAASHVNRYRVESVDLEDLNSGQNARPIQLRRLNVQLLTDAHDHAGFSTIPLMRIRRADHAEGAPELDRTYIPPLLAVDAWRILEQDIVRPIYDRIGKKLDLVANQVVSRGITFDSTAQGDRVILEQMRVMNEAYAAMGVQAFTPGVHPLEVFKDLLNFIGRMAVFTAARRVPDLPKYDHDDLGTCFWSARRLVDAVLDAVIEAEYGERAFVGAGQRVQVALEPAWIEAGQRLFVAVTSSMPTEQTRLLVEKRLDMKIGAGSAVDELYRLGRAGLQFSHQADPPRCLPMRPGRVFFGVDTKASSDQWDAVQRSLSLAVRFNENLIAGDVQNRTAIDVIIDGRPSTLEFVLYVVPPSAV